MESTDKSRVEPSGQSGVVNTKKRTLLHVRAPATNTRQRKHCNKCQSKKRSRRKQNSECIQASVLVKSCLFSQEQKLLKKTDIFKKTNASHYRIDYLVVP